jgi:hypothetical protein
MSQPISAEVHADPEHPAADQPAGDARRDAEPEDVAPCDHAGKVRAGLRFDKAGPADYTRGTAGNVDAP